MVEANAILIFKMEQYIFSIRYLALCQARLRLNFAWNWNIFVSQELLLCFFCRSFPFSRRLFQKYVDFQSWPTSASCLHLKNWRHTILTSLWSCKASFGQVFFFSSQKLCNHCFRADVKLKFFFFCCWCVTKLYL